MTARLARLRVPALLSLLLVGLLAGCGSHAVAPLAPTRADSPGLLQAIRVNERAADALLGLDGVVGSGAAMTADGEPLVVVLLDHGSVPGVPLQVQGVPVLRVVTGPIHPWALTDTYRPLPNGVSCGNANQCIPGTVGCVLLQGNQKFLLSANHVFARQNQATLGEAIAQPSPPDLDPACGPVPSSAVVAQLADFQPVVYDGKTENAMDAAIARASVGVTCATPAGFYGAPSTQTADAVPKLPVQKLGRTTGLTHAQVHAVDVKVKITFPSGTALFVHQILTTQAFGDYGDSGALVVTDDGTNRPVGMVIGGSSNGAAIVTPIQPILARFGATICTH